MRGLWGGEEGEGMRGGGGRKEVERGEGERKGRQRPP
jgi:hypothetical protein